MGSLTQRPGFQPVVSHVVARGPDGAALEQARRRIVFWVFVFYWLLIFEGALRKWALPSAEQTLFFVRVPVTLFIYWLAARYTMWPRSVWPLRIAYVLAAVMLVVMVMQMAIGDYDRRHALVAGYGWHNYFLYIPLAFIVAERFRPEDVARLVRHTLWISLPMAALAVMQFLSPGDAVINQGWGLDESELFPAVAAALGYIRPTGTFTTTAGLTHFGASAVAMLLSAWFAGRRYTGLNSLVLCCSSVAIITIVAVSQSRGLWLACGLVGLAAIAAGILLQRLEIMLRTLILPTVGIVAAIVLVPLLFPEALEAFSARWDNAYQFEARIYEFGIFGRALAGFYKFIDLLPGAPTFGYLMGLGGNAAYQLPWVQVPDVWAEDGWSRHIVEMGPFFGIVFIGFRIALTVWIGWLAVLSSRRSGNPLPIILFGYVGIHLLYGQVTGQGTLIGYGWLFAGLCLADARPIQPQRERDTDRQTFSSQSRRRGRWSAPGAPEG